MIGGIVVVRWHDAGAGEDIEAAAAHVRESVGYLLKRNRRGVWIAMESDALSGVHFIPRAMVLELRPLPGAS